MAHRSVWWTVVSATVVLGVGLWWAYAGRAWLTTPHEPESVERSVQPIIHHYLLTASLGSTVVFTGMLRTAHPELDPRWFCAEDVIESRMVDTELRVGLWATCEEYGHRGGELISGSGSAGPVVVTLSEWKGSYLVLRGDTGPNGSEYPDWVERNFSPAGANRIFKGHDLTANPAPQEQARREFDLAANAPVTGG